MQTRQRANESVMTLASHGLRDVTRAVSWLILNAALVLVPSVHPGWAGDITLRGELIQGGLVVGRVAPGSRVSFAGKAVRVSDQGYFVIGFGRDEPARADLLVKHADGQTERRELKVVKRNYDIQRIDGLSPTKVTPPASEMQRIGREAALIKKARHRDDARTDFLSDFVWPLEGRISGVYGSQRILNGKPRRPHYGVDVAADTGTQVRAPAAGVVSLVHPDMYFTGGTLMLDHGHGLSSIFSHLSRVLVEQGQRVAPGDVVAEVGATGRATGPHLHWGMNWFERRIDPQLLVGPMSTAAK